MAMATLAAAAAVLVGVSAADEVVYAGPGVDGAPHDGFYEILSVATRQSGCCRTASGESAKKHIRPVSMDHRSGRRDLAVLETGSACVQPKRTLAPASRALLAKFAIAAFPLASLQVRLKLYTALHWCWPRCVSYLLSGEVFQRETEHHMNNLF